MTAGVFAFGAPILTSDTRVSTSVYNGRWFVNRSGEVGRSVKVDLRQGEKRRRDGSSLLPSRERARPPAAAPAPKKPPLQPHPPPKPYGRQPARPAPRAKAPYWP